MRWILVAAVMLGAWAGFAGDAPTPAEPKTVEQADDGSVLLHSRNVYIHGSTVRYEPDPHKNTVGFWVKQEDWVSWTFTVKKPGTYTVEMLQGCGKGSGGADVEVSIGEQKLKFTVEDTGGFQNFKPREIGTFTFDKAGEYVLNVKPVTKPGMAVMDLRQVLLTPKK